MKRITRIFAVAILMGSGAVMAVAQPDPGPAGAPGPGQAQAGAASREAQGARALTIVPTELMGKIDTKKAKVGEEVTTIVSHPVTLADGTELPKGTKVMGHVVQVKAHSKEDPGSVLGLAFDSAVIKGGKTIALRTAIRNVAPPAGMNAGGGGAPMGAAAAWEAEPGRQAAAAWAVPMFRSAIGAASARPVEHRQPRALAAAALRWAADQWACPEARAARPQPRCLPGRAAPCCRASCCPLHKWRAARGR